MQKILIGIASTPHLSIKNITRYFVQEMNVRHEAANRTPLDLHTHFLIWGGEHKINAIFNGLMISGITTDEDASYIRKNGGVILHIEHANSLFKTSVTHQNADPILNIHNSSDPTSLTLDGFIATIEHHFNQRQQQAA